MKSHSLWFLFVFVALCPARSEAHFLFIRVTPPAEGGRAAEVYFSELAEAGDPRFIDKIAHTTLRLQRTPGKYEALTAHKAPDRLRAWLPATGSLAVEGDCTYGVLGRPKQTPFLLRHFPRAVSGSAEELNRLKPDAVLAIVPTFEQDGVQLQALKDGKPFPNAEFVTVDASLANTQLKGDAEGKVFWKPAKVGVWSVYTRDTRKQAGELRGKKYDEIRDFATLSFSWPLQRKDADAEAVTLFEEALAARSNWVKFPGFKARIAGNLDGRRFRGGVSIDADGTVLFTDDDTGREESVATFVQEQLGSIVLHRIVRPTTKERPRPVLRFGEMRDDHPLGRLLIFDGGRFASTYRIKDKQITAVNRVLGKENLTILTLENDRNKEGRFLPRSYLVQYWEDGTGRLLRTETVRDSWQRVGDWDLPREHTVTTTSSGGLSVRGFTLEKHEVNAGRK